MRALSWIGIVVLASLLNGCMYIGSDAEPRPDGDAPAWAVGPSDAVAMAPPEPPTRPRPLRAFGLDDTATLPGRTSEPPIGIPFFDVAVVDYELAEGYPNPIGGIERPPGGARVLFVLIRATNVTPLRGRPPQLSVALGETALRGCLIAPGDRVAYDFVRDALPDETVEGWLCRIVPATARVQEISVAADRRLGVGWRLVPSAAIAP
jgi:hypothetical protein